MEDDKELFFYLIYKNSGEKEHTSVNKFKEFVLDSFS